MGVGLWSALRISESPLKDQQLMQRLRIGWAHGNISLYKASMLAKKTIKNQITLPKAVITRFGAVEYFDVSTDGECIILRPLQRSRAEEVRTRLSQLGINEQDVADAISWARKKE